ncbi:MAG: hypothetical protein GTN89_15710 [Acidobacteria bacterium]|nr:hypothetical protein [Acidobacteriota bacterium]NIM62415.1 hypothetical protein [Acidobacteriota bacterium]NIO60709.1 hypothetical protein [Acidobacteriota bacterium]NIQ31774.1 hypothetical protein [Acidobacteriota bacterium]NIQ87080.1 hypothetical protein [Acidobacteriota bacterium]
MRFRMLLRDLVALLLLVLLGGAACRDATELPAINLESVYERTDRDFESAVMFRPDDATAEDPAHVLAPLIVVENGAAGSTPPEVTFAKTEDGWVYRWTDPASGIEQGIRVTLGADGFPAIFEVLHDSSGARLLFVEMSLEQQAADAFGPPLPGRRFSIERGIEETPDVVVGATFEPGTTPLGPFVYLWSEGYDVNVVLCRCMAPRVFDIVDSIAYTLTPGDPADMRPSDPAGALRL